MPTLRKSEGMCQAGNALAARIRAGSTSNPEASEEDRSAPATTLGRMLAEESFTLLQRPPRRFFMRGDF